jgi:hypothetical protein
MMTLPEGARPLHDDEVTPEITTWATECLHDASMVFGDISGPRKFGELSCIARIEEHTWYGADPGKPAKPHRGVTIYAVPEAV